MQKAENRIPGNRNSEQVCSCGRCVTSNYGSLGSEGIIRGYRLKILKVNGAWDNTNLM